MPTTITAGLELSHIPTWKEMQLNIMPDSLGNCSRLSLLSYESGSECEHDFPPRSRAFIPIVHDATNQFIPMKGSPFSDIRLSSTCGSRDSQRCTVAAKRLRVSQRDEVDRCLQKLLELAPKWFRFDHPNIAPFLGLADVIHKSVTYAEWVIPWYNNGNLGDAIDAASPDMPFTVRFNWMRDIAAGLSYLHSFDPPVIHGNLRPSNVMITDDGRAALIDYDLVDVLRECHSFGSFAVGTDAVTCRWMSPEIMLLDDEIEAEEGGASDLMKSADVWAFACVCYQIFTGKEPYYQHRKPYGAVKAICAGDNPRWEIAEDKDASASLKSILPDILRGWIEARWTRDPAQRGAMDELVQQLEGPMMVSLVNDGWLSRSRL